MKVVGPGSDPLRAGNEETLASDLEWLLESGEAGPELLAEALVREYYRPLYRLALATLGEAGDAQAAAMETFIQAVLVAYRYHGRPEPEIWLYSLAVPLLRQADRRLVWRRADQALALYEDGAPDSAPQEGELWQAFQALPLDLRLPLALRLLQGRDPPSLAALLRQPEAQIERRLADGLDRLQEGLRAAGVTDGGGEGGVSFFDRFQERWPPPELSDESLAAIAAEVARQARAQSARRKRRLALAEALLVGLALLVVGLIAWRADLFRPGGSASLPPAPPASPSQPPRLTSTPRPTLPPRYEYIVQEGETLEGVAERLGVSPGQLAQWNRLDPLGELQPFISLRLELDRPPWIRSEPGPVTPVAHRSRPLSARSTLDELRAYLQASGTLWRTLWADARLIYYGLPGYAGPAQQSYRQQVWISQPDWMLTLGSSGGNPQLDEISLTAGGLNYQYFGFSNEVLIIPASEPGALFVPVIGLLDPLQSLELTGQARDVRISGEGLAAGRRAVILEWQDDGQRSIFNFATRSRAWIDAQTGVVLRQQVYAGEDLQTLIFEQWVQKIRFDIDFPFLPLEDFRQLGLNSFAANYQATPLPTAEAFPKVTVPAATPIHERILSVGLDPPAGFDPAQSWLTFQYADAQPNGTNSGFLVQLFAGKYFLGEIPDFLDLGSVRCDRSPDGRRVAYSGYGRDGPRFGWFDLVDPGNLHDLDLEAEIGDLAFAPDGESIAFVVNVEGKLKHGVYVYNLRTGVLNLVRLLADEHAESLVWSPDGEYLAMMLYPPDENIRQEILVFDSQDGDLVYRASWDQRTLLDAIDDAVWPPPDFPGHEWGVRFPVQRWQFSMCAAPPTQGTAAP